MPEIIKKSVINWSETLRAMKIGEEIETKGLPNLSNSRRLANYLKGKGIGEWSTSMLDADKVVFTIKRIL